MVTLEGGALFDAIANLPADETAVYGTAGNASAIGVNQGSGFINPITILFPTKISNFSVDVLNGNTQTVDYRLADNLGNTADFNLAPNLNGGLKTISFATAGNQVTISAVTGQSTPTGMTWDFLIDNVKYVTSSSVTATATTPEPASMFLIGVGLITLGLIRHKKRFHAMLSLVCLAAATLSAATTCSTCPTITLTCPAAAGTQGSPYSSTLSATGGVEPYTFSIVSGGLPAGLALNASNGAIQGTPTNPGPYTFQAEAVDSLIPGAGGSPDSATISCTITIAPAPAPTIITLNPPYAISGGPSFLLTVLGTNFAPNSIVFWNGQPLPTSYISSAQLTAQISSGLIGTPKDATITVTAYNQTSNGLDFPVEETWMQITDIYGVTFGQLDPTDPASFVADWNSGLALADSRELSRDGISGGYLQVIEYDPSQPQADGLWVVQNLPVENPNVAAGIGAPFVFGVPPGRPIQNMQAAVFQTRFPVPGPRPVPNMPNVPVRPPVNPNPPVRQTVPIHPIPNTIGGLRIPPPTTVPELKDIQPVDPKMEKTDSQESLTDANSVEQRTNECAPAAVANSLQYLKDNANIDDKARNVPSGQQGSRVGILDQQMGYNAAAGTSTLGILTGKQRYINGANPTGRLLPITMNSQGRFCPGASIDPNCPGGQNGDSGATPTVDFITKALADRKDVEVCFAWPARPASAGPPPTPASPGGAHCVFVTGYRYVNGYLTLDYTHDLNQGRAGGVNWEDGGHMSMRVGIANGQLWIRNFFDRPAMLTHVITEGPK
jgi:hypothetical protein